MKYDITLFFFYICFVANNTVVSTNCQSFQKLVNQKLQPEVKSILNSPDVSIGALKKENSDTNVEFFCRQILNGYYLYLLKDAHLSARKIYFK